MQLSIDFYRRKCLVVGEDLPIRFYFESPFQYLTMFQIVIERFVYPLRYDSKKDNFFIIFLTILNLFITHPTNNLHRHRERRRKYTTRAWMK